MTTIPLQAPPRPGRNKLLLALPLLAFGAVLAAGETWAKWWPYSHKLVRVASDHVYPGHSILAAAGAPGAAPSLTHAWNFAVVYGKSVWVALVAALFIGAGVQALVPRARFVSLFGRRGLRGALAGAAFSLPCMMCTCCGAPVTNGLRRAGASTSSALAYWLGNPLLNPAVLAFLALVLPWPYTATRVVVGLALVVGVSTVVARLAPSAPPATAAVAAADPVGSIPRRYVDALVRLALILVPEYFVVVLAVGALRGWLLPLGHAAATWGIGAVLVAAAAGTLLVIPTGAEIPIIFGLVTAGFATGVTGALLIAPPASVLS